MKNKYGIIRYCSHCGTEFATKPRFLAYCSTPCKNPINRPGNVAWNKGIKLTDEQRANLNTEGLKKGHGWNRGLPNERQRIKWLTDNPNKDGKVNNRRPKKKVDTAFSLYKSECLKATYRSRREMKKEGLVPNDTGKRKTQYQLDHIIPFMQGFELNIDPAVIGGKQNLRYILGSENRSKWDTYQTEEIIRSITGDYNVL
jgi:hypothetical protein